MSDPAPKAKRRRLIIPWTISIVAVLGWSAYWVVTSRQIASGLDAQAQAMRSAGYTVEWANRTIGGFPFRYFIQLDDVRITKPGALGITAPHLEAEASALMPKVVVIVAPAGLTLDRPVRPDIAITGEAVRMSIAGFKTRPVRISMEGLHLNLASPGGQELAFSAIDRFEAHLRPTEGGKAQLFVRIDKATASQGTLLARLSSGAPVTVGLEGEVTHAARLKGRDSASVLQAWSTAGGGLNVTQGGVATGESLLSLKPSTLSADADGFLTGQMALSLESAGDAMLALGQVGVLPPETAAVASGVATAQSAVTPGSGLAVTLSFENGQTLLGPVPIGAAPRLFQPAP